MTIFLASLLTIGVLVFILSVRAKDLPEAEPVSPFEHLDQRKAAIYENLRDLQFEYRVGKLSDADYQQTKLSLQKELAAVLAEITRLSSGAPAAVAAAAPKPAPGTVCPHCKAQFPAPMKFCGQCGKGLSVPTSEATVVIDQQVELAPGVPEYDPLVTVKGFPSWPSTPRWEQLKNGNQLTGFDFENAYPPPDPPQPLPGYPDSIRSVFASCIDRRDSAGALRGIARSAGTAPSGETARS